MLFNSLAFGIFLPIVFAMYWMLQKNLRWQNLLLLGASFYFYACWDYRFLFLLAFSIFLDYFSAHMIHSAEGRAKQRFWLILSIGINLGFLAIFKYYNFFAESFAAFLGWFGIKANFWTLKVILPVGISFYTFHGLSYIIDVYKKRISPEKNFVNYAVFVSYFPLLVAGPIERATHLLPQIQRARKFDLAKASEGMRRILWGLFKKIVIADNCAEYANTIFNHSAEYSGLTLVAGALFFTFQIYCDFSGYSDIALGTSRLFGIDLLQNFAFPYFSRDIAEFWRRWHISLSSWFRDYLYIPLGGSKGGVGSRIRNTFIIFLVSGFWHGANWTFVAWGFLNALYFTPLLLLGKNRNNMDIVAKGRIVPGLRDTASIVLTFALTVFAWIFFRADSISHAFQYIGGIFSGASSGGLGFVSDSIHFYLTVFFVLFFLATEWYSRDYHFGLKLGSVRWFNWLFYLLLVIAILLFGGAENEFIYFQF